MYSLPLQGMLRLPGASSAVWCRELLVLHVAVCLLPMGLQRKAFSLQE